MHTRLNHLLAALLICCLVLSLGASARTQASADDQVIGKVLTTLSSTPVALGDPSLITVATSSAGCSILSAGWFNANNQAVTGAFNAETYRLEINVGANAGYLFAPDVACYLNNSSITGLVSSDRKTVTLTREYTADVWAPTIYKNPGDETVDEGGWASFVVAGAYVREYQWMLSDSTDKITIPISQLKDHYHDMESSGDGSSKLLLYHIPYELNNWKVICNFVGAGNGNVTRSKPAILTVRPSASRIVETPVPSDTPVSEASPAPEITAAPDPTPEVEEHSHDFSGPWLYDARGHWHECPEDGAAADEGLHAFAWTEVRAATATEPGLEEGVCSICGYKATRNIGTPTESADSAVSGSSSDGERSSGLLSNILDAGRPSLLMSALCALLPIDVVLLCAHHARASKKKSRRRR